MKLNIVLLLSVLLTFISCQKEIDIDLNDSSPKVVIEANYNATDSVVTVLVSKTGSYFDEYSTTYINDAVVTIRQDNGADVAIPFISDGKYELGNYIPAYGSTYTVTVSYDGTSYTADCKLMPTMELLPATIEYQEASIFTDEGYWITYRFQDFPGKGNCYKIIPTYGGVTYNRFGEFMTGEDKLTDGNLIERPMIETFQLGDTVYLELQSISQKVYDYYSQLADNTSGFTAAAGNPDYLWSNGALGYFSAYSYSSQEVIVVE